MIKERLRNEVLKSCFDFYKNPWFLVKKKEPGKYKLMNVAFEMNKVTIRNVNFFFSVDEFSKQFVECMRVFLMDLYSGYDQFPLIVQCRDFTVFQIPIELVRMTIFFQKAINSVGQFMRIITRILMKHIFRVTLPFMDDIGVKGPKNTSENNEEVATRIKKKVLEHIQ